jgi:hypothetical protein
MGTSTFSGPVRSLGGFIGMGPGMIVPMAVSTMTIDPVANGGKTTLVTYTGTGGVITLPIIIPTGPTSNIGVVYDILFGATVNAAGFKIITGQVADLMVGMISITSSGGSFTNFAPNGTSNRAMNLNGGTTGGIINSDVTIRAIAANKYQVSGQLFGTATFATPFADS